MEWSDQHFESTVISTEASEGEHSGETLRPSVVFICCLVHLGWQAVAHHLEFEQWVPFPLERVFGFFSNPENLPRIMPASSGTKLIVLNRMPAPPPPPGVTGDKAAGPSSTIVTSFRVFSLLPFRAQWIARITAFEWNQYFEDVQEKGPFKSWHHRHEFQAGTRAEVHGTLVRDVIEYEIGLGFLGAIANALFVRRQMERIFRERQRTLPKLLVEE